VAAGCYIAGTQHQQPHHHHHQPQQEQHHHYHQEPYHHQQQQHQQRQQEQEPGGFPDPPVTAADTAAASAGTASGQPPSQQCEDMAWEPTASGTPAMQLHSQAPVTAAQQLPVLTSTPLLVRHVSMGAPPPQHHMLGFGGGSRAQAPPPQHPMLGFGGGSHAQTAAGSFGGQAALQRQGSLGLQDPASWQHTRSLARQHATVLLSDIQGMAGNILQSLDAPPPLPPRYAHAGAPPAPLPSAAMEAQAQAQAQQAHAQAQQAQARAEATAQLLDPRHPGWQHLRAELAARGGAGGAPAPAPGVGELYGAWGYSGGSQYHGNAQYSGGAEHHGSAQHADMQYGGGMMAPAAAAAAAAPAAMGGGGGLPPVWRQGSSGSLLQQPWGAGPGLPASPAAAWPPMQAQHQQQQYGGRPSLLRMQSAPAMQHSSLSLGDAAAAAWGEPPTAEHKSAACWLAPACH